MCIGRKRVSKFFSLALCMLVAASVLFITSPAFADSDVPADGTDGGSTAAQTEETTGSDQPADVEETEPAADASSTEDAGTSEGEQEPSSTGEGSGEEDAGEAPNAGDTPVEDEAGDETDEQTDENASDQENEPGEGESSADNTVSDDAESGEDGSVSSDEETGEISETEEALDETAVELVDEEGEALDKASQEDAELASSGDPYWKVGTQYYSVAETEGGCYPGTSVAAETCWVSSTPITTALAKIEEGLLPSDRKLYVKAGEYNGHMNISGVYLSQLNGLIGVDGSAATILNGSITIANNTGGFTLSGFTIWHRVQITNCTGNIVLEDVRVSAPSGDGIRIENGGSAATVKFENVNSSNNLGMGAYILNLNNVTVTNSSFNKNGGMSGVEDPVASLFIDTSSGTGIVTLNGVSASDNNGTGIYINAGRNVSITNVIANSNRADSYEPGPEEQDYGHGLYLSGYSGKYQFENVFTNGNELIGTHVDAYNSTILMANMNSSDNGETGIEVFTQGALTIKTATTNSNGSDGILAMIGRTVTLSSLISQGNSSNGLNIAAYPIFEYDEIEEDYVLVGYYGPTSVILNSPKSGGMTMANNFSGNGNNGVYIRAKGNVTLSNLDTSNNGSRGIYVDNDLYDDENDLHYGKGSVTINSTIKGWNNGVVENGATGIEIQSLGTVKIYETMAFENSGDGVYVETENAITIDVFTAKGNGGYGAYLSNLSALNGRPVSVTEANFVDNGNTGLMVLTAGAINLKGTNAIGNMSPTLGGPLDFPISIHDIVYSTDATESWGFYGYNGDMLSIMLESDDFDFTVTLYDSMNNVIADAGSGAGSSAGFLTALGSDDWYRIEVSQSGMVGSYGQYILSINDSNHEHNLYPGSGMVLDNSAGNRAKVVILTTRDYPQNIFENNQNYGLKINTTGAVIITGATANHNYTGGLYVVNPDSTGSVIVQDKSSEPSSFFDGNGGNGINIQTQGTISLYGVSSASFNSDSGILLVNSFEGEEPDTYIGRGSVTFNMRRNTMSMIEGNDAHGLAVLSNGTINVTNVIAVDNGGAGTVLENSCGNGSVNVKTSGTNVVNEFSRNGQNTAINFNHGLFVVSKGNISVKNSIANENNDQGVGIVLSNEDAGTPRNVQVNGGETSSNSGFGLLIESKGAVSIMNFNVQMNGWNGIDVDACQEDGGGICQGNGSLRIMNVNSSENGGVGIQAHAYGVITVSKVSAGSNGDKGIRLNNQFDGSAASVSLIGVSTNDNNDTGILVTTNGSVTMKELQSVNNKKMHGYLEVGRAVFDYYNQNAGSDTWWFDGESGVELTFRLFNSDDPELDVNNFTGRIELYDDGDNLITEAGGANEITITWTPTESGSYYLRVKDDNDNNGFYRLSINNSSFTDMEYYYADGIGIFAGKNVTLTGSSTNSFDDNSVTGFYAVTSGNISLRNIAARGNGTEGVYLDNYLDDGSGDPSGYGKVNVSGLNDSLHSNFDGNGWQGLMIKSANAVSLLFVDTCDNGMEGIKLGDSDAGLFIGGKINAKNLNLVGNGGDGMDLDSLSAVSLSGISALGNGSCGVNLANTGSGGEGSGNVILSGSNYFWDNNDDGIYIASNGDVRLSGIDGRRNGNRGIYLMTEFGLINLDKTYVQDSGSDGIFLGTRNRMDIMRVTSIGNGKDSDGDGMSLRADENTIINIKQSTVIGNGGNGIEVWYESGHGLAPTITSTLYFGNDVDYDGTTEQANIYIH